MENKYIYFLGIGGIGMSALAQYFHKNGNIVAGYDRTPTKLCKKMEATGIKIHYEDKIELIPDAYKDKKNTLVILTPAIPKNNNELNYFRNNKFKISKRAEVLGLISNNKNGIAVAGTHGKTSVSTITAWIMSQAKSGCNAFLGGISKNFKSNIQIDTKSEFVVVEADEFDRSFHQLTPSTALITSLEADHLDIYGNFKNLEQSFIEFTEKIKSNGKLIINEQINLQLFSSLQKNIKIYTYGINNSKNDFYLYNIIYKNGYCYFNIKHPFGKIENLEYAIGGNHNLENALAATTIALLNNISEEDIRKGLKTFKGVERRFDIQIKEEKLIFIDDYAHHPSEIKAFLNAVQEIYPERKITAVFQAHLYTRTKDFYQEFAESLSVCENLILLPIYPAREKPIKGIEAKIIYDITKAKNKFLATKEELIPLIKKLQPEIIVTMGAGDIDKLVNDIKNELKQ